jgi:hypothetical protein
MPAFYACHALLDFFGNLQIDMILNTAHPIPSRLIPFLRSSESYQVYTVLVPYQPPYFFLARIESYRYTRDLI